MAEQLAYYDRIKESKEAPQFYMSLIVDAMATLYLPLFILVSKGATSMKRIKGHCVGLIKNSTSEKHFYSYLEHWKGNGNITATILLLYLMEKRLTVTAFQ
jgi:hypothetical protein